MKVERKIGKFVIIVDQEEKPDDEGQYCRSGNCA